jgi:ABC-type multidrug transport system fused ATPase/permease subunit
VFSVAQSRFALPSQIVFFLSNIIGLVLGTVYNANTPDLYENNAHHKMGWVFTWFAAAWIILGVLNLYAGRYVKSQSNSGSQMSIANLTRYSRLQRVEQDSNSPDRRWSGDSGQGTERNSDSLFGTGSPGADPEHGSFEEQLPMYNTIDLEDDQVDSEKRGFLQNTKVDRFLTKNIHRVSSNVLTASKVIYILFERLLVVLGFAALLTGIVTFGGLFVSILTFLTTIRLELD